MTTDTIITHPDKAKEHTVARQLPRIVTTSWDDGDVCDLKIGKMLLARKLQGTFYIPITGHHGPSPLGRSGIQDLGSEDFEIGGHGFSHRVLPRCMEEMIAQEVETSKQSLEDIIGREVRMFAYPQGRYSSTAIRCVKRAGYAGARTTEMLAHGLMYDPYKMPTTIQVFPHPKLDYLRNAATAMDWGKAWTYLTQFRGVKNWIELAKILFDSILAEGGVFHLYGHSWEIDNLGLWNDLEEILDYVSNREGVCYLTNGSILDYSADNHCRHLESHCAVRE